MTQITYGRLPATYGPEEFTLLKLFPQDDAKFAAFANAALASIGERAGPVELQRVLRERYPSVRVRMQERIGMNGESRPHWYVFRDGRLIFERAGR